MRRYIGIGLLIVINAAFLWLICWGTVLRFGLIVKPMPTALANQVTYETTIKVIIDIFVWSTIAIILNFFILKKLVHSKKSMLISGAVTTIGILISVPFFISARQSFIDFQNGTSQLQNYLNRQTISSAIIITGAATPSADSLNVELLDNFLYDIGTAKYKRGPWKYGKTIKIIFNRTDGSKDSIPTNGQMFGAYKGKYFSTDSNVITKYLVKE